MKRMNKKIKVLIVTEPINRVGGIEKYCRDLTVAFGANIGAKNVKLISAPFPQLTFLRKITMLFSVFYNSLRFYPNYIVCGHIYLSSYVTLISRWLHIPYIICTHGIEVWRDLPLSQEQHLKNAVKVITISGFTRDKLVEKGISADKIFLIHPYIDTERFNSAMGTGRVRMLYDLENKKVVLIVARMSSSERYKGHEELIRAMPEIIREIPEAVLLIVGGGDDAERLQDLGESLGLKDRVIFTGKVNDDELPFYYNACDVFAMPSRVIRKDDGRWGGEGFGIVFLEASACGKPVIGASSGGIPDAVAEGETGLLVDPEDKDALKKAIIKLLIDKTLAEQLGNNGRQWAMKYDIKLLTAKTRKLLEDLEEERCAA